VTLPEFALYSFDALFCGAAAGFAAAVLRAVGA